MRINTENIPGKGNRPNAGRNTGRFAETLDRATLESLLSSARDAIILIDEREQILSWNQAAEQLFGYGFNDVAGKDIHTLLAPADQQAGALPDIRWLDTAAEGIASSQLLELGILRSDGSILHVELALSSVQVSGHGFALGIVRDISERKQLEQALARTQQNFISVVELNRAGIIVLDRQGKICFVNQAAETLLDRGRDELLGLPFGTPAGDLRSEMAVRRKDGSRGTAEMSATETEWEGQPAYLVMLHDVTELKQAEANARFLALHDMLTGLPNRRLFQERLEQAMTRSRRSGDRVALLFLDLNRFKAINDSFGHNAGDTLLCDFSRRLTDCFRASDTVARLGGDEFAALIEGVRNVQDVHVVATKLDACLSEPYRICDSDLRVSTSIGVALFPDDAEDVDTLLRRSDAAMYAAKQGGSGHIRLFTRSMEQADGSILRLEQEVRGALERGELRLVYQPIGCVAEAVLVGMEALLRWRSPVFGEVTPDQFIPLLESSGDINAVGAWVVEQVCAQLCCWRDAGLELVPIAVNVSAVQFSDGRFPEFVRQTLKRFALPSRLLVVELTETAVVRDETAGTVAIQELAQISVGLHMDDFGTGWSSLGLLRKLPFDTVKIDRSFVADIVDDQADALLVAGIVSMVHSLGMSVVAEGVETETQLSLLQNYGCDQGQGWLFGRPADPLQLEPLLRERKLLACG